MSATLGQNGEPFVSIGNIVRNIILYLGPWRFNRSSVQFLTAAGTQDYTKVPTDFGFLENAAVQPAATITNVLGDGTTATITAANTFIKGNTVTITGLTTTTLNVTAVITAVTPTTFQFLSAVTVGSTADSGTAVSGQIIQLTEVLNTATYSVSNEQKRPNDISVLDNSNFRLSTAANGVYQLTAYYMVEPTLFGPFLIGSAGNASAGHTTYTGVFTATAFPAGSLATISGFVTSVGNNGVFTVVSCSGTQLVLVNAGGVLETPVVQAVAINSSWSPIPDSFSDIYNNFCLGYFMDSCQDPRGTGYIARGGAALLAKAEGLSEMDRAIFMQSFLNLDAAQIVNQLKTQQGRQASGAK